MQSHGCAFGGDASGLDKKKVDFGCQVLPFYYQVLFNQLSFLFHYFRQAKPVRLLTKADFGYYQRCTNSKV